MSYQNYLSNCPLTVGHLEMICASHIHPDTHYECYSAFDQHTQFYVDITEGYDFGNDIRVERVCNPVTCEISYTFTWDYTDILMGEVSEDSFKFFTVTNVSFDFERKEWVVYIDPEELVLRFM